MRTERAPDHQGTPPPAPARGGLLTETERQHLAQEDRRDLRRLLVVLVLAVLAGAFPAAAYLPSPGRVDHLLGRDVATHAEVVAVHPDGRCGRSSRSRVEVRYDLGSGPRLGSYRECGAVPGRGAVITVWVGPGGTIEDRSPAYDRVGLAASSLVIAGLALAVGWLVVARPRRLRQLLREADRNGVGFAAEDVVTVRGPRVVPVRPPQHPPAPAYGLEAITGRDVVRAELAAILDPAARRWRMRLLPPHRPLRRLVLLEHEGTRIWAAVDLRARPTLTARMRPGRP
ncbi:hypothetical protein [Desertihabitans aurantiacus]|uniref:hypothetical protein n=1 Tax=Desertihabitans aurantiacus TaxID=2282477 RepID=UPI0013001D21|nr:hypothetical protein [Desertihabitans aurantiacus]